MEERLEIFHTHIQILEPSRPPHLLRTTGKKEKQINEGKRAAACHIHDYFWKTGGAFALIPFPSHTASWPVYTVPIEKGDGRNCDSAQSNKKRGTFGISADDLKKKKVLNQSQF